MSFGSEGGDSPIASDDAPDTTPNTPNTPPTPSSTDTPQNAAGDLAADPLRDDAATVSAAAPRMSLRRLWGEPQASASPPAATDVMADPADTVVAIGKVPPIARPRPPRTRVATPMPTDIARGWIVTVVLTTIGALVRFWQLGWRTDGGTPLFDEKYYAVQAAEMLRNGGMDDNQAYGVIVHPPLGKQLIAISEWVFGYNPVGWRFASAVAGTLCIALIIRSVRRLTRSTLLGGIAGILLIADGVSHVMARTALLDSIQVPFIIGAFACLLIDRDQVRQRLAAAVESGAMAAHKFGIPLYARWWRFSAGVLLGCATAVKWSGAYWLAAFGIMCVIWDISARKQYGIRQPVAAVLRRDFLPSLWSLAVVPVVTYLASYWAWFTSEASWDRHAADDTGGLLPAPLRALIGMTFAMLKTTAGITTNPESPHPWESKPFAWPLSARPVLYYLAGGDGTTGCGAGRDDCVQRILLVGTPAMWWISLFVLAWALWKSVGRLDWRYAAVIVGYSAGFLPWLLILDRQMYFFYMTPVAPFLIMGIVLVMGDLLGAAERRDTSYLAGKYRSTRAIFSDRRMVTLAGISIYVGLVVANFAWLWPILMGNPITPEGLMWRTWLPSWG